jgi:hypothetical protein
MINGMQTRTISSALNHEFEPVEFSRRVTPDSASDGRACQASGSQKEQGENYLVRSRANESIGQIMKYSSIHDLQQSA